MSLKYDSIEIGDQIVDINMSFLSPDKMDIRNDLCENI